VAGAVACPARSRRAGATQLVVVSAQAASLDDVVAEAGAHPTSHYAIMARPRRRSTCRTSSASCSTRPRPRSSAGAVAGLVAGDQGGRAARVAVGRAEERRLSGAVRGVARTHGSGRDGAPAAVA